MAGDHPIADNPEDETALDASAVLALLNGEKGWEKIDAIRANRIVSSVNVAEVLAKLVSRGLSLIDAQDAFGALHLDVDPFRPEDANLSARFVGKNISLGDRCFLATAARYGSGWTADAELCGLKSVTEAEIINFR